MRGSWTLGEVFILRHAGFPFDWIENLGVSEELLAQVDALLAAERALIDTARTVGGEKAARRVEEALRRGQLPPAPKSAGAAWHEQGEGWRQARERVAQLFPAERERLRLRLHALASEPEIQEAVFLSSPDMFENVWARYVAAPPGPDNADTRRVERQVYSYLQRFCAKNETTSFFGPMGYGEISGEGTVEVVRAPGPPRRRSFLSFWAVQELARAIGREKGLRPYLPLRKNPTITFEPGRAHCQALGIDVALGPDETQALAALDQAGCLSELAAALGVELAVAERRLLPLLRSAVVVRGLRFPTESLEVFQELRAAVEALPECEPRGRWLAHLARLDGLRGEFERGDLSTRRRVLPALEAAFTELTGLPARRGEGQMYSDRLVLYEEAASPFRLRIGRRYAETLAQALSPALDLSAAYGARVQAGYQQAVQEKLGAGTRLGFLEYAARLRPDGISGSQFSPVEPLRITGSPEPELTLSDNLCGHTEGGRFSLPDVCLQLCPDGSFKVLLARVHHHLLLWSWLCAFHEDRPRVERVARRWLEGEPSARNLVALALTRRNKGFYCYPGPRLAYTAAEALEAGPGGLSAAELTVEVGEHGPELRARDGERRLLYLPLADFSTYPPFAALAHPLVLHAPLRTESGHVPRLRVGGATYQRERWEADLSHLEKLSGLELFLAVRRETYARAWPRFLFGRATAERKPLLMDTASPFSLDLVRHLARGDGRLSFEEMLPRPDELFLRDERGRYTFELRMQAERWSQGAAEPAA